MADDVKWTAREALACAYCWSEFSTPENTGFSSPEAYWLSITERARADCRRIANGRLLLATARGEAVPVMSTLTTHEIDALKAALRLKRAYRVHQIIGAVRSALTRANPPRLPTG